MTPTKIVVLLLCWIPVAGPKIDTVGNLHSGAGLRPGRLLLVDKENVGLSLTRAETLWAILDHMDADLPTDEVWVVGAHGFGTDQQQWLRGLGVNVHFLEYIKSGSGLKNGADIALAVLAVDSWLRHPFQEVGLAAGDFDFRPLLAYLHDHGCTVTLLHTRTEVPPLLSSVADRLVPLAKFRVDRTGATQLVSIVPRHSWDKVRFPWNSIVLGSTERLVAVLQDIAEAIDRRELSYTQLERSFDQEGILPDVPRAALHAHDAISPRGALLHPVRGSDRPGRLTTLTRDGWIEEAYLVWIGAALAAVVAKSSDPAFRTAVFMQAKEFIGDDLGLVTAWGRVQHQTCPPRFVAAAERAGVQAPSDAWVRYDVLHHLHKRRFPSGRTVTNATLNDALNGAPARLNPVQRSTLLGALSATVWSDDVQKWVTAVDGQWLRRVVRRVNPHVPCDERRLKAHYFYDTPPNLDAAEVVAIAAAPTIV